MFTKNFVHCIIAVFLVVAIPCFTFIAITVPNVNFARTVFSEETATDLAGLQTISNMSSAINIPDVIVSPKGNNTSADANEIHEFFRRYNNKQSIVFVLLALLVSIHILVFLRFWHGAAKTMKADMPVLALSLGGNSPPVIRA